MASRVALGSLRAAVRPQVVRACVGSRTFATPPPPAERASEIIDKLPSSPNLITKTGTAVLGTGLIAAAISQELYVVNEETVVAVATFILLGYLAKIMREPYRDWADGHIQRIKGLLDSARAEHTQVVKDRIASVEQMKDVVSLTKGLFAFSKETAQLESETFVQQQKVAMASELKAVLDSWVRYEQQVKENEQADLVKAILEKVNAGIKDEKVQKEILVAALAEVELLVKNKAI